MKYILFGASQYMYEHIDEEKIKYFAYIVDNSSEKIGTKYLGKEIKNRHRHYWKKIRTISLL